MLSSVSPPVLPPVLPVARESRTSEDIRTLDQLWSDDTTFLWLPNKGGLDDQTIARASTDIAHRYPTGHFCLLTSGSTGTPKIIIGAKSRAETLAGLLDSVQDNLETQATVGLLSLSYCFSFVNQWLWAKVANKTFVWTKGLSDPKQVVRILSDTPHTMLCLVGSQLALLDGALGEGVFPYVLRVHFAGGPFPESRLDTLGKKFPNARFSNNYGCAEAMPRLTFRWRDQSTDSRNVGTPIPGVALRTREQAMEFRSDYSAIAIWEDGSLHNVGNTWMQTGDSGEQVANGSWSLHGRHGQVKKRFGEKISLLAIEKVVAQVWVGEMCLYWEAEELPPSEEPVRSTGPSTKNRPNSEGSEQRGQILQSQIPSESQPNHVLVLAPAPQKDRLRNILQALRKNFSRPHWPTRIETATVLPKLSNGKIDTQTVRKDSRLRVIWKQRL